MPLTRLLRRRISAGSYIPEIDSLRFVAISLTISYHFLQKINLALITDDRAIASRLSRGVPVFFVISGFVLAMPFASSWLKGAKKVSLPRYYLRRLTRLEPPYILALLLCTVLLVLIKHQRLAGLMPHLAASLLYLHNVIFRGYSSINPVAWSLEVEVQFYVLVPLLTRIFAVQSTSLRRTILVLQIVICGVGSHLGRHQFLINHTILGSAQYFLAGFLLADLYLINPRPNRSVAWDLVSLLGWPLVLLTPPFAWRVFMPFGLALLFWSAFYGRVTNRIFRLEIVALVGGMCYSYYLLHQQIISIVFSTVHHSTPVRVVVGLSLILVCCTLYYVTIERPCMNPEWPRILTSKLYAWGTYRPSEEHEPSIGETGAGVARALSITSNERD